MLASCIQSTPGSIDPDILLLNVFKIFWFSSLIWIVFGFENEYIPSISEISLLLPIKRQVRMMLLAVAI
jgi:hypothetical protein